MSCQPRLLPSGGLTLPPPRRPAACLLARLQVAVQGLAGSLLTGRYEVAGEAVRVTLHRGAGVQQLGGTLMALPFVEAPGVRLRWGSARSLACLGRLWAAQDGWPMSRNSAAGITSEDGRLKCRALRLLSCRLGVDWRLPGGRPADQHHLFPTEPPPEGALQEPVYVSSRLAG